MQVEVGAIVNGKVTGLTNFGAFVSLPDGKTGMVHISEVAPTYVKEIRDFLTEDQEVKVKVLNISEEGKISLSIKRAEEPEKRPEQHRAQRQGGGNRPRRSSPPVWQGSKPSQNENLSFEDMMARFKQVSDEKMTDLKRSTETKHGGFSRRGNGNHRQ